MAKAFDLQALMHAPQPHPKPKAAPRVPPDAAASGVVAANAAPTGLVFTNPSCMLFPFCVPSSSSSWFAWIHDLCSFQDCHAPSSMNLPLWQLKVRRMRQAPKKPRKGIVLQRKDLRSQRQKKLRRRAAKMTKMTLMILAMAALIVKRPRKDRQPKARPLGPKDKIKRTGHKIKTLAIQR